MIDSSEMKLRMEGIAKSLLGEVASISRDFLDGDYIFFGGIGSVNRASVYSVSRDWVNCGCFSGTLAQFKDQIAKEYKERQPWYYEEYMGAVAFIETVRAARQKKPAKIILNKIPWPADVLCGGTVAQAVCAPPQPECPPPGR